MTYDYDPRFERTTRRLHPRDRQQVVEAVQGLVQFFERRQTPGGLGVKKLFSHPGLGAIFEIRATLSLRVVFSLEQDRVTFLLVGNHEDVRRFIRSFQ